MKIEPIIPIPIIIIIAIVLLVLSPRTVSGIVKRVITVILVIMISVRIMVPSDEVTIVRNDIDVLFVVDNTISMLAEDYSGKTRRIDAVKTDIETIMNKFEGARFSVVTFANDPMYLVPYTTDRDVVLRAVNSLQGMSEYAAEGTSFRNALIAMQRMLEYNQPRDDEDEEELENDRLTGENRVQVVFLISDGEMTVGRKIPDFDEVEDMIDDGAVLGYGTEEGGQMRVYSYASYYDDSSHVLQYTNPQTGYYEAALSKIDEENLNKIADDMGVDYVHMTGHVQADRVCKDILDRIDSGDFDRDKASMEGYSDTYWIGAGALGVLLLIELFDLRRKLRATE